MLGFNDLSLLFESMPPSASLPCIPDLLRYLLCLQQECTLSLSPSLSFCFLGSLQSFFLAGEFSVCLGVGVVLLWSHFCSEVPPKLNVSSGPVDCPNPVLLQPTQWAQHGRFFFVVICFHILLFLALCLLILINSLKMDLKTLCFNIENIHLNLATAVVAKYATPTVEGGKFAK